MLAALFASGFLPFVFRLLPFSDAPALPAVYYDRLFDVFSLGIGAIVGSFLNVCIYRLPLGMAVNKPDRSFCPHCKTQIRWYHNLPVLSWLALRGKCAYCGKPIAARYPLVELLTALLFFFVWRHFYDTWILVFPYWIFVSLVIVATFIDFDHFIIPDEITLGCVGAGLILSLGLPLLMGQESHGLGLLWSLVGAAAGYGLLWGVVEAGKLAFGKKRVVLPETVEFTWRHTAEGNDAEMVIGGETELWSEYFMRPKDRLVLLCEHLQLAGREHATATLACFYDRLELDGQTYPLDQVETFSGRLKEYIFPREAMGFGDVKFIAGIGAFLGWKAVLFTVAAASMVGSVVGVALLLSGPKSRSLKIPFGPYLSVGALLWMYAGPQVVGWYLGLMGK